MALIFIVAIITIIIIAAIIIKKNKKKGQNNHHRPSACTGRCRTSCAPHGQPGPEQEPEPQTLNPTWRVGDLVVWRLISIIAPNRVPFRVLIALLAKSSDPPSNPSNPYPNPKIHMPLRLLQPELTWIVHYGLDPVFVVLT